MNDVLGEALLPRSVYGWRAKTGVIVPPTNTVNEASRQPS